MQWKQFFTPAESIDSVQAGELIRQTPKEKITLLDVRQPKEYQLSHLPGSKLIPLPELSGRLDEINPEHIVIVY